MPVVWRLEVPFIWIQDNPKTSANATHPTKCDLIAANKETTQAIGTLIGKHTVLIWARVPKGPLEFPSNGIMPTHSKGPCFESSSQATSYCKHDPNHCPRAMQACSPWVCKEIYYICVMRSGSTCKNTLKLKSSKTRITGPSSPA